MKPIQIINTPEGPLALVVDTAKKLLAEGVLTGAIDGELKASSAAAIKAAILTSAICDFCSSPGAAHYFDVPDFGMGQLPGNYGAGRSTGGWMACDECNELIVKNRRKDLLERAVTKMAFPKFTRRAIDELYQKFWAGMDVRRLAGIAAEGIVNFVENRIPPKEGRPALPPASREQRVREVQSITGLTPDEIDKLETGEMSRDVVAKIAEFCKGLEPGASATILDLLSNAGLRRPLPNVVPHWQRALDMKFDAAFMINKIVTTANSSVSFDEALDINNPAAVALTLRRAQQAREVKQLRFQEDVDALRHAQAYSFNGETMAAILEASKRIPHDSPLSSIDTPNKGAGWFWFGEPMNIPSAPAASDSTDALLWTWTKMADDKLALRFSAFVVLTKGEKDMLGHCVPTTKWFWPLDMTFHEMIAYNTALYRRDYGTPNQPKVLFDGMHLCGEDETLRVVAELSLFFVMSCLWFKQTVPILTREPGQVERQARKRMVREHKLPEMPSVQVVALRRSAKVPSEKAEGERQETSRHYGCRWIVQGHPRLQACGPGRKDRKLIWIETHIAGPDDKPLKTRERVYAVVR